MVEGFKETEVGLLPSDWVCERLPDVVDYIHGKAHEQFVNENGEFVIVNSKFISSEGEVRKYSNKNFQPGRIGDILTVLSDLPNGKALAKCFFVDRNDYYAVNQRVCIWRSKGTDSSFLFHVLNRNKYFLNLNDGVSQTHILNKHIEECPIQVPPTKAEQTAIATALNDADALITALEKLIAKKKAIKQGAIQELLTGKVRLAGFKEEWITELLPNICWFQEGPGLRNWQFTKYGIKVINVTNLENGYLNLDRTDRHISLEEFNRIYKHFEIDENDIVVASSGNSYGKVAVVRKMDLPLLMNTSVIRFKPLKNLDYHFLLSFLKSNYFKDQIDLLITGGAQPNFGPYHLKKIEVKLPKSKTEQNAIAQILNDMDLEIVSLEQKLEKQKQLKQGMMQVLLTGKIRLV